MLHTYASIILSLFFIEILLSIDNALVNATLAESLPENERKKAIRIGILLGALFRLAALLVVVVIIQNPWLKVAGGLYLIYIAMVHLGRIIDEKGDVIVQRMTFGRVVFQIALADIVFSLDNVVSAASFSQERTIVVLGVGIGIVSMLFITPILSTIVHTYKGMPQAAYAIVGLIGVTLLLETYDIVYISEVEKFFVILFIILFTILYEHSALLRLVSTPLLRKLRYIIAFPLDIIFATGSLLQVVYRVITRKN